MIHGAPHRRVLDICRQKTVVRAMFPVRRILQAGPDKFIIVHRKQAERSGTYYAQSWALAHYLMKRVSRERLEAYVEGVMGGKDPVRAFEQMMGKTCGEVDADLSRHLVELK